MNNFTLKISFAFALLSCFLSTSLMSQTYWGNTTLSGATNEAIDVENDALGNQYVAGYFSGGTSFQLGSPQLNSSGNTDIYVSKYSPSGALLWVKTFGGSFSDKPTDLALDNLGNILVTGEYFGQVNFGATTLTSTNSTKDIFILKLNNSGAVQWAISEGDDGSENAFGITVDGLNNIILTGQYLGNSNIGGQALTSLIDPLTNSSNYDLFISKYTDLGTYLWVKTGIAKYAERGLAVSVDSQNDIFLTGQFSDTLTIAGTTINNTDFNVGLLAKINAAGALQWLNLIKANTVIPYDLEINNSDEPVIIGDFTGAMQYFAGATTTAISAPHSNRLFAMKVSNSGSHIWNKTFSSNSNLSTRAVSIDAAKNVFLTGYFECGWTEFQPGTNPSATFNSVGFKDPYLISIDNLGTLLFVKTFGSDKNDVGMGIAFDNQQNPVICGSHTNNLNIPTSTGPGIYQNSANPFDFNLDPIFSYQNHVMLGGDLTANSFLTNAIHAGTPDYNYFVNTPVDSLNGFISPTQDTIHFCYGVDLFYYTNTQEDHGPGYDYTWSNGGTGYHTYINQTGVYTVQVQREDGCAAGFDTIVGILDPIPLMPLMNDNLGIAVNALNYPSYQFCAPDSVSIWFSDLCLGCTINILPAGINDTLPHTYAQGGEFTVTVSNGSCTNGSTFWVVMDTITPYDSIQPYLYFVEDTDHNDTIQACLGDLLTIHAYDTLSNPPLPILNQFHSEPFNYFDFSTQNSLQPYAGSNNNQYVFNYIPDTSGWYVFNYFASIGFDNECGVDTIHYYVTDSVYIDMAPALGNNFSITSADSLCPSSSTFLIASPSDTSFTWSGPNIVFINTGNDSAQVAAPGTYHYQGAITDSITGCVSYVDALFELEEKAPPTILTNPLDGIICPGDSVLLQIPNIFLSYNWIDPNGNSPSNTNTLTANTSGFYYCNVVDSNGCTLTSTPAELNQYNTPSIYADPQNIVCGNTPLTIAVSTNGSPNTTWINPASGGNASQITVTQAGTYICQLEQCGITTIDSVTVIDGSFSINLTSTDTLLCYQDTAVIAVDTGYTYVWSNLPDSTNSIQATTTGNYSVTATNQYGCEAYSDTILIITAPFAFPPNVDDTTLCSGDSVTLVDNGFTVVYWYDVDTNVILTSPSYSTPPLFQTQTVYAGYNALGCPPAFDEITITVIEPLANNSIIGDSIICTGDSTILQLSDNIGPIDWHVNSNFIVSDTAITVHGSSTVQQILAVSANECFTDSLFLMVITAPVPSLDVNPDTITICGNDIQTVMATSLQDSILWTTPFGLEYGTSIDVTQSYPNGTTIQIQALDTNLCPSNLETVYVQVTDSLDINITSTPTICLYDNITITANADANIYTWSGPSGTTNNNSVSFHLGPNQGQYTIQVIDSLGCEWTKSIEIQAIGDDLPSLPDTIFCFTDWLKEVSANSVYFYSDGTGVAFDTLAMSDNFTYTIMATNSFGCQVSQSVFILTVSCDKTIPNVITPNGDGINDFFLLDAAFNQANDHLKIFNRWGSLVYEKTGYLNQWNGGDLVDGVYFYLYTWDTQSSSPRISQGFVTITR